MKKLIASLSLCLSFGALSAVQAAPAQPEPAASAPAKPAPKAVALTGKILETMDGGGYTYVLLGNGLEKTWVAAPQMKVSVGQLITFAPGFEMKNFSSKALNRKFDKVMFTAGVVDDKPAMSADAVQKAHKGVSSKAMNAALKKQEKKNAKEGKDKKGNAKVAKVAKVEKAAGPNAYRVAEVYANRKKLEKKPVVVRGTVVKVASGILKRNWIHLQDGSGKAKKNNDLVFTSTESPNEGDVITASGTLANNRDFGYGYKYAVIVEGAKFSK